MKAFCCESSSDVTTCSDVTSQFVHSKTPLHRRAQASCPFGVDNLHSSALRVGTSCCHSAHFNCSPFNRRSIRPAVAQSFSHHLNRHKDHVPALGGSCPLAMRSSCVAPSPKSSRQTRFFQGPQLPCDAQTTPLPHGVCANAAPQNRKNKEYTADCKQNKNSVERVTSTLTVYTHLSRRLKS